MPDPQLALRKYRQRAPSYDRSVRPLRRLQRGFVGRLELRPGDVVLDVACGTGLNFPPIQDAIGKTGRLIGVDLSPDMLARARDRLSRHGWENVTLIESAAEEARIPEPVDAVLVSYSHDVMRSPRAMENVIRHLKADGRIVAGGSKCAPWWAAPLNLAVWYVAHRYATTVEGYAQPWSLMARLLPELQVESRILGTHYLAWSRGPHQREPREVSHERSRSAAHPARGGSPHAGASRSGRG